MNNLKQKITHLLKDEFVLRTEEVDKQGLSFAYVESASHFTYDDQALISEAFQSSGYSELVAFALEKLNGVPDSFRVPSHLEGVEKFDDTTSLFNYVLSSEDGKCFVVCTVEDYYIVCGPKDFVEKCLGKDLASAKQEFADFAQTPDFPDYQRTFLLSLLQKN